MRVALIGATGNVGSCVLAELVRRGHSVTAISRNPDRGPSLVGVVPKRGNVIDQHGVAQLLKGHDAVISSIHFTASEPRKLLEIKVHFARNGSVQAL